MKETKNRRITFLLVGLNLTTMFLGSVGVLVAGVVMGWLVEPPMGPSLAIAIEVALGLFTLQVMMIVSMAILIVEKRLGAWHDEVSEAVARRVDGLSSAVSRLRRVLDLRLADFGLSEVPAGIPSDLYVRLAMPLVKNCRRLIAAILTGTRIYSRGEYYLEARLAGRGVTRFVGP